ncbi:Helix-turn-helix domain-containing protein [Actinokineospora alba]|uniref:Helix-turn-helix domain-containing protein n=1 Tax=Actinokineospora alba TaxID=504798 RepID=A0A1H0QPK5_9PSEU|nr:helix-turn-helix domain-containing protein [Actinokineospora alba]TDP70452.1 helix-turn-helix protein [Actinokineospora alba]SDI31308.1 Helix-turn-helix domain-containing protein [Actinokineospora alba]SDP19274.1 Helix-turn-helix domain-containing protein [Actinokineospora alba]
MRQFGPELRQWRIRRGHSLSEFARMTGYTKGHLSKIENNKHTPSSQVINTYDRALHANGELIAQFTAHRAQPAHRSTLPTVTRHFVGHGPKLDLLAGVIVAPRDSRVLVITGLGGSGKTTLAIMAARRVQPSFPDGTLFVDLRGYSTEAPLTAADTAYRLLRQLATDVKVIPADPDDRTRMVRQILSTRQVLVVLDNARSTDQVSPLLPEGSSSRVIVTSRHHLAALDEAIRVPLGMLDDPDAIALFRAICGERPSVDDDAVVRLVRRCGGLPLAIRIAASRFATGSWTMARFVALLDHGATVLTALNDGERSVTGALELSYSTLAPRERKLLALLTIHPYGPIAQWSAEAWLDLGGEPVDEVLDRLHDANLITRDEHGDIGVHDLVRAFAVRHAASEVSEQDRQTATSRLIDLALGTVVAADRLIEPHRHLSTTPPLPARLPFQDADTARTWLRAWWPMVAGVVELAAGESRCWHLALALRGFFFADRLFEPWVSTHRTALSTAEATGDQTAQAMILNSLGMAHVEIGELAEAADAHQRAQIAYAAIDDRRGEIDAQSSLAWVRLYQGRADEAITDLDIALAYYRSNDLIRNTVIALRGLAFASTAAGRHEAAADYAREAAARAQQPLDAAMGKNCLAWVDFHADRLDDAARHYSEAVELASRADSRYEMTRAFLGLGNVESRQGRSSRADDLWRHADDQAVWVNPATVVEATARHALDPRNSR